jgi:hypothetical protein
MRRGRTHTYLARTLSLSWWAVRVRGEEFDQMLAEGVETAPRRTDTVLRRRCEARGRLLVRRSFRCTLAGQIEGVLFFAADSTAAGEPGTVWAADIQPHEVREASPSLRLIVAGLQQSTPPRAQGVALALLLLRDGRSPLYGSRAPGELKLAAEVTALALTSPVACARGLVKLDSGTFTAASRWWREPAAPPPRGEPKGLGGSA